MEAETRGLKQYKSSFMKPFSEVLFWVAAVLVIGRVLDLMADCRNNLRDINDLLQERFGKRNVDELLDEE